MKPPALVARGLTPLSPGVRDLVQHAAESMGLSLEVWKAPGRSERLALGPGCCACEEQNARVFDRCRKRRAYLSRREVQLPAEMSERCPRRLRLARLGAPAEGGSTTTLFAFGYAAPAPGETDRDERVLSFLRDLRQLVDETSELQTEMSQMTDELSTRYEEINLLYSVSGKLSRVDDLHTTVVNVLGEWRRVLDADCAFMWLRERALLEFSFADETAPRLRPETRTQWEMFARRLAETLEHSGQESCLESLGEQHPVARLLGRRTDCVAVPLRVEGRLRGVVCGLRQSGGDEFGTPEVRLLGSLAGQLSLAVANSDLYADLKSFLINTVKTLVSAIDAKDAYTCGHSERVNIVSMLLGNEMNLELEELEALYWGSLLHDVGKIGMPESILNKSTTLDAAEIAIVKQHPLRGWEMLHAIDRLRHATEGVRFHHERWDGQGYPQGGAGADIPMLARIIAVADAFDAIISNRSYRKSQSAARALEIITAASGTQFDPEVVAALGRLLPLLDKHQWVLMSGQKVTVNYSP